MKRFPKSKFNYKAIIYLVIVFLFIYLIYQRRDEALKISEAIGQINWWFLVLALLVQALIQINQSRFYQASYEVFGLRVKWTHFFWLLLRANFYNMVTPSGGFFAAVGLIVNDGVKMGLAKGKLLLSNVVYWVVFYVVFIFFLICSLFFLLLKGEVADYMLWPSLILLVVASVFFGGLLLFLNSFVKFRESSLWVAEKINQINARLGVNKMIKLKTVRRYSFEIYEGYSYVISNIWRVWELVVHSFGHLFLNTCLLTVLVVAAGGSWLSFGVLGAAYTMASLLMVISVTPSGLGLVELALTSIVSAFVLPLEKAVMVVVLYRLFQFWLPLVAGFWTIRNRK